MTAEQEIQIQDPNKNSGRETIGSTKEDRVNSTLVADDKEKQIRPREVGGPAGPEPTRYGDWEVGGRCSDF